MNNLLITKELFLCNNGFDSNGDTWLVVGDNTFAIKDKLKEVGCKYSPLLKWHNPYFSNLQEIVNQGFTLVKINYDDIYEWDEEEQLSYQKLDAKITIRQAIARVSGPDRSEYVGAVGQKISHKIMRFTDMGGYMTKNYGWMYIYTFKEEYNIFCWMTSVKLPFNSNTIVDISGFISKHDEYRGKKITYLKYCEVSKVG